MGFEENLGKNSIKTLKDVKNQTFPFLKVFYFETIDE
jgi:hypothetical protein